MRACWKFFVVGLLLAGCSSSPSTPSAPLTLHKTPPTPAPPPIAKLTVSPPDDLGRKVALKASARRIIVIGPGATETLFTIGAGTQVIGRDSASNYPVDTPYNVTKVPVVGDFNGPNVEKAITLKPDLVVVQGETYGATRADDWQRKIGAPVAVLAATTVQGVANGIVKLGAWTGHPDDAKFVAHSLTASGSPANSNATSAFIELGRAPLSTAGRGTLLDDVLHRSGLRNLAANVNGYANYNVESLIAHPPDVYVLTYNASQLNPLAARGEIAKIQSDPKLKSLQCLQNGNAAALPADWLLRPGPRLALAIKFLHLKAAPK